MNEARPTRDVSLDLLLGSYDYGGRRPQTAMEALMQAAPGDEPEESMEEVQPLREVVAMCIDMLGDQDKFVINAINSERVTLQELGDRLGVSRMHASRLRDAAFDRLRLILEMHPLIRRRVEVADTWEQSAMQWVNHLARIADASEQMRIETIEALVDKAWKRTQTDNEAWNTTLWTAVGCAAVREMRLRECWDAGRMVSTLVGKQCAYGHGNINKFGTKGILVRLSDKVQRYKNLTGKNTEGPQWEPLEDTLMDMVGYAVVALMYDDGTFQLEVSKDYES